MENTQATVTKRDGDSRTDMLLRDIAVAGESVLQYDDRSTKTWLFSSIWWLFFVDLVGLTMATELIAPNIFRGIPWIVFSRIRPIHVNGVILFWLSSMYFGGISYILPRLLGVPSMWSEKLGIWCAWLWNLMAVLGTVTLALGYTTGREYFELIWPVAVLLLIVWLLNLFNIIMTVINRRVRTIYVTVWWMIASPIWLALDYFIAHVMWIPGNLLGNGVPGGPIGSALPSPMADAMLNWWGSHNLFGLWLTPMLIAITYYMVPRITNTPLYSHVLSLFSFWGIIFFYAGVGHHHLLQAPIPGWLKTFATVNSIMLLGPVFAFILNIWLTMRGNWEKFVTNLPLRFTLTGFIFYLLVNIQGSFQAVPSFNTLTHFTNFVVAHAHLALLGGFTILGMGLIDYIIPQIYKKPIYSRSLAEWQYWLIFIGFTGFFLVLTGAGFIQGQGWAIGIPEVNLLPLIRPWYIGRAIFGGMIVISGIVQMYNIWMTIRTDTNRLTSEKVRPFVSAAQPMTSTNAMAERGS